MTPLQNEFSSSEVPLLFVELKLESDMARMELVRNTIKEFLIRTNLSDEDVNRTVVAVYEACSNVAEHAYSGEEKGELLLRLSMKDDEINISVFDKGESFDIDAIAPINWEKYIEEGKKRGLGIHLIKQIMDKVEYKAGTSEGNCLAMMKKLKH